MIICASNKMPKTRNWTNSNTTYNHRILDNENPSNFDFDQLTTIECGSYTCILWRIEFRGCQSTFDSDLAIAWLNLGRSIVDASYAGTVLEPKERSREESWVSLFNEIVQDKELEGIFVRERQALLLSTSSNWCNHSSESASTAEFGILISNKNKTPAIFFECIK